MLCGGFACAWGSLVHILHFLLHSGIISSRTDFYGENRYGYYSAELLTKGGGLMVDVVYIVSIAIVAIVAMLLNHYKKK